MKIILEKVDKKVGQKGQYNQYSSSDIIVLCFDLKIYIFQHFTSTVVSVNLAKLIELSRVDSEYFIQDRSMYRIISEKGCRLV